MKYLIDDARQAWKFWSVRLAMLAGVTAGYLSANPDQTQALAPLNSEINLIQQHLQTVAQICFF